MNALDRDLVYGTARLEARAMYALLWARRADISDALAAGRSAALVASAVLATTVDEADAVLDLLREQGLVGDGLELLAGVGRTRRAQASAVSDTATPAARIDVDTVRAVLAGYTGSRRALAAQVGCSEGAIRAFASGRRVPSADLWAGLQEAIECVPTTSTGTQVGTQVGTHLVRTVGTQPALPLSHSPSPSSLSSESSANLQTKEKEEEEETELKGGGVGEENLAPKTGTRSVVRSGGTHLGTQGEVRSGGTHSSDTGAPPTAPAQPKQVSDVAAIFDHWKVVCKHERAVLDPKRRGLIERALKSHGLTVAMDAVTGCSRSAWHMGANDRGARFDDLTLILRDASRIEQFAAMATGTVAPTTRVGQAPAKIDYQGNRITGAAPMPTTQELEDDVDFDEEIERRRALYARRVG